MEQVPEADVVVTNPTEIAVALRWESEDMDAPEVVAKGRRTVADRIKEIAREHGVPVVERKPLAQALEKAVDVGMEVPPHLYYAVAEVLSFVMQDGHSTEQGF
jgi:flagellar biosynthetic protein FlhB